MGGKKDPQTQPTEAHHFPLRPHQPKEPHRIHGTVIGKGEGKARYGSHPPPPIHARNALGMWARMVIPPFPRPCHAMPCHPIYLSTRPFPILREEGSGAGGRAWEGRVMPRAGPGLITKTRQAGSALRGANRHTKEKPRLVG